MGAPLQLIPAHDAGGHLMRIADTTSALYPQLASTSPMGATTTEANGDFYARYTGANAFQERTHIVIDRFTATRKPSGSQSILIQAAYNNAGSVAWRTLGDLRFDMDVNRWVPNGFELGARLASFDPEPYYGFRVTSSATTMCGMLIWRQIA